MLSCADSATSLRCSPPQQRPVGPRYLPVANLGAVVRQNRDNGPASFPAAYGRLRWGQASARMRRSTAVGCSAAEVWNIPKTVFREQLPVRIAPGLSPSASFHAGYGRYGWGRHHIDAGTSGPVRASTLWSRGLCGKAIGNDTAHKEKGVRCRLLHSIRLVTT